MSDPASDTRCRLVLVSPSGADWREIAGTTGEALGAGDVASAILWPGGLGEDDFQKLCEALVPAGQAAGVAMVVAGEMRVAHRVGADGVHVEGRRELELCMGKSGEMIVGAGGARTRHEALEIGELRPDYLLFGRFGYDARPEPHPRNLALGAWWSELVEIPCIVLAGADPASVRTVARTGAEFVAVSAAVFASPAGPAAAVREANRMLDEEMSPKEAGR